MIESVLRPVHKCIEGWNQIKTNNNLEHDQSFVENQQTWNAMRLSCPRIPCQGFVKVSKTWQKLLMVPATDHHIQLLLLIDFGWLCQKKHRKNCECSPVSQLIVRWQRLSWIQVLNCLYCNRCLKCHNIAKVFFGQVRSPHHTELSLLLLSIIVTIVIEILEKS